jgi:hypothetical protein
MDKKIIVIGIILIRITVGLCGCNEQETTSDEKVILVSGKDYWAECVVSKGPYYYESDPDNKILGYTIFW